VIASGWDAEPAVARVVAAMLPLASPARAAQAKSYLKSDLDFLGVSVPDIRRSVIETARSFPRLGRDDAVAWARALWCAPVHERRTAAIEVLRFYHDELSPADLGLAEGWVRVAHGWAYVDPLAGDIAGPIARRYPQAWPRIDEWAEDEDFWLRRAALLTLLAGIRAGLPDLARFERYATPMLAEREFFIAKAVGWVLRETAKKDPAYVAAWTGRHLDTMSAVTFREAVRRLPETQAAPLRDLYRQRKQPQALRPRVGGVSVLFQQPCRTPPPFRLKLPVSYFSSGDRRLRARGSCGRRNLPAWYSPRAWWPAASPWRRCPRRPPRRAAAAQAR